MPSLPARCWHLLRETGRQWWHDKVARLVAALAYYAAFAVAPLLVIGVKLAVVCLGADRGRRVVAQRLRYILGDPSGQALQGLVDRAAAAHGFVVWPAVASGVVLLYVSGRMFNILQAALSLIWGVEPDPNRTWRDRAYDRAGPFALVLGAGLVLLLSLAAGPVLAAVEPNLGGPPWLHILARDAASAAAFAGLFAAFYRVLPDVRLGWSDVAGGGLIAAVLFTAGEHVLEWHFGHPTLLLSVYGAAGSAAVLLVWVHYSAYVLLLGAEFTQVYARSRGHGDEPARGARQVSKADRAAARPT